MAAPKEGVACVLQDRVWREVLVSAALSVSATRKPTGLRFVRLARTLAGTARDGRSLLARRARYWRSDEVTLSAAILLDQSIHQGRDATGCSCHCCTERDTEAGDRASTYAFKLLSCDTLASRELTRVNRSSCRWSGGQHIGFAVTCRGRAYITGV